MALAEEDGQEDGGGARKTTEAGMWEACAGLREEVREGGRKGLFGAGWEMALGWAPSITRGVGFQLEDNREPLKVVEQGRGF